MSTLNKEQLLRRDQIKQLDVLHKLMENHYSSMSDALDADSSDAAVQIVIDVSNLASKAFSMRYELYYINKRLNKALKTEQLSLAKFYKHHANLAAELRLGA